MAENQKWSSFLSYLMMVVVVGMLMMLLLLFPFDYHYSLYERLVQQICFLLEKTYFKYETGDFVNYAMIHCRYFTIHSFKNDTLIQILPTGTREV